MKAARFPVTVRRGSVATKVYKLTRSDGRTIYTVSWHAAGVRRTKQFPDYPTAYAEATLKADQLAAGRVEAAAVTTADDAQLLAELRKIAGNVPVGEALREWAKARDLCDGQLMAAARAWKEAHVGKVRAATVKDAVAAFLRDKRRAGVDTTASYEKCLPQLVEAFGERPIASLSARALADWLHRAFAVGEGKVANPVTFNSHRKRLVSLWRWCRKHGYLPATVQTEGEKIEPAREQTAEIGIVSVKDFARVLDLLREKHPKHLAAAVIAGFCGLRRTELHAQRWEHVHLERGVLHVSAVKRNTPAKRLVPLPPAAREWLMLCDRSGELVSPPWALDRIRVFAREAGIATPDNGFRHGFISHRVAATGNVAETSLEAGNSPTIVHRHYRALVDKADGELWFALTPAKVAEIVADEPTKFPEAAHA